MVILLYILCTFLFLKLLMRGIRKAKIFFFKKKIEKNPLIGIKDLDGTYLYKKNGYILRYIVKELPSGEKKIQLVSYKSRLTGLEEFIYKIKRFFQKLIFYSHIKPSLVLPLFLIIIIVYIWILIPESKKARFYKLALSRAIGVSPEQVEYKGRGWFEIYGKRIPEDKRTEPLHFTINPLHWLFFSDYGYVTRWRGKEYGGYKTHYLETDKEGEISTEELGRKVHGKIEGDKIKWDVPTKSKPFVSQDIEITEEGIRIVDH